MKYLGIDYGSKRLGLAISDPLMSMAFPLVVLDNNQNLISGISAICKEKGVTHVVVGDSRDFSQKENEIMKEVHPFVERLKQELGLDVVLHPEFMTSLEAERLQGSNNLNDASAAAIMLTHFLQLKKQ